MTPVIISISDVYTQTPGGRYRVEGAFSGEDFRERVLQPILDRDVDVVIDLDGPKGFTSGFLEEAFGGLVRKYGPSVVAHVTFRAEKTPDRAVRAQDLMQRASDALCGPLLYELLELTAAFEIPEEPA